MSLKQEENRQVLAVDTGSVRGSAQPEGLEMRDQVSGRWGERSRDVLRKHCKKIEHKSSGERVG